MFADYQDLVLELNAFL